MKDKMKKLTVPCLWEKTDLSKRPQLQSETMGPTTTDMEIKILF